MKKLIRLIAVILSALSALLGTLHLVRVKTAAGTMLLVPKMVAAALAPILALSGFVGALLGTLMRWPFVQAAGMFGAWASARYFRRTVKTRGSFETAFGTDWSERIPAEQAAGMLKGRWAWRPTPANDAFPIKDVPFYTIPGSERHLLCDLWQPPMGVARSGLAFIYFHGSGWHFLDKDVGTQPLFRLLATQGHVVMDVAYRLCPETGWRGMLDDVKQAVAWMKRNAARYGVDPERIVLGGGSAGAHLALLAAYTAERAELAPEALLESDLSVAGVVSWYGPTDMTLYYHHAGKLLSTPVQEQNASAKVTRWLSEVVGIKVETPAHWQPGTTVQDSMMCALFGGTPDELPEMYWQASPIEYAGRNCPPTLLLYGEHDSLVAVEGARALYEKLRAAGVKVVYVEYPQTEHAFDLILPTVSPAAQASWYEVERFLALLAVKTAVVPERPGVNGAAVMRPIAQPVAV